MNEGIDCWKEGNEDLDCQHIWNKSKRNKVYVFFYIFAPIAAIFSVANLQAGNWAIGFLEIFLLITAVGTMLFRHKISIDLLSQISVTHITVLTYAFIFLPVISGYAYIWVVGLPFFTSYLVSSRSTLKWSLMFLIVSSITGAILFQQGEVLYWDWKMGPYLALAYIVMAIFSVLFARQVERYHEGLRAAQDKISKDAKMLEESEERYRTLLHSSMNAVGVHRDGCWVFANPMCLKLLGADSFEEIVAIPIINFVHPDYRQSVWKRIQEMNRTKEPAPTVEEMFLRVDGEVFPAEVSAAPIIFDGKESIMITIKDVAERKKHEAVEKSLQQQLEHAQRLESLGVLAGGIAHDFNNLLAVISGNSELLRSEIGDLPMAKEYMGHIDESCSHAANLCKQMLAYAGKGKYSVEAININSLVKSMSRLMRSSVDSNIVLKVKLARKLPMAEGDIAQIQQIILNFIVNSAEAIGDDNGEIKITTFVALVDDEVMSELYNGENLSTGKYVVLEVKDTGMGISKELQKKIFDPFFTTKEKGSGLGLSAILGIVKSHKGAIFLSSEEGVGSVFRAFLPVSEKVEEAVIVETGEVTAWKSEGLVLIVDDDQEVQQVARAFVEKVGFDVVVANDGVEGVQAFEKYQGQLKAVLLDMTMPNMNGHDAMKAMRKIKRDIPIVLVSGYSEKGVEDINYEQSDAFLQKPFRFKDVKKVLYKAIGY